MKKFKADICPDCGQSKNYSIMLDRGCALILLSMANACRRLGRNRIHLLNDMLVQEKMPMQHMIEEGYLTSRMIGNATRPRYHGLIAFYEEGGSGEYVITRKGGSFLHGEKVKKEAIVDKMRSRLAGYWDDGGEVTIFDLLKSKDPAWNWSTTNVLSHRPADVQPTLLEV